MSSYPPATDEFTQYYDQHEAEVAQLQQEIDALQASLALLHAERDQIIALAIQLAAQAGLPAGLTRDTTCPIPEFEHVVAITLPAGQVSWNIPYTHLTTFRGLPHFYDAIECVSRVEQQQRLQEPLLLPLSAPTPAPIEIIQDEMTEVDAYACLKAYSYSGAYNAYTPSFYREDTIAVRAISDLETSLKPPFRRRIDTCVTVDMPTV